MNITTNTIVLITMTLAIAGGAYWFFFTDTGNQPPLTPTAAIENRVQTRFQELVSTLQPISFDIAIFSDPRFMSLSDLSTPIAPESAGRPDPFAVIGVSGK